MRRAALLKNGSRIRDLGWKKFGSRIWDPGILDKYADQ